MVVGVVEWVKSRLFSSENIEEKYDAEKSSESESETPESCVTESSALPEEKYNAEQSSKSESDSLENFVNCSIVTITESKVLPEEENLLEMDTELTGNSGKKEKPLVDQASCSHHKGDVMKSGSKQSAPPENKPATPTEKKSSAADASVKSYVDKNFTKEDSDSEDLDPRNPDSVEDLLKVTQNNVSDIPLLDSNFWTWTPEILKQFLASADKNETSSKNARPDREMEDLMKRLIKMMGKRNQEKMEEFEKQVENTIKNVKAHLEKHKDK